MVRDRHAFAHLVEDPVVGASQTSMVLPVPGSTSLISRLLDGCKFTGSVDKVIANIAGNAGSKFIESFALVRDRDTDSLAVEDPVV